MGIYGLATVSLLFYLVTVGRYVEELYGFWLSALPVMVFALTLYHMTAVSFRDPGIIPKRSQDYLPLTSKD